MGILDLTEERAVGMSVDDLLEGLDAERRAKLEWALTARNPIKRREHVYSAVELARHCAEDGFEVSEHSIKVWRRSHEH